MVNQPIEVAVVGGGMVGAAAALGLAQHGFSVAVIEHQAPEAFVPGSQPDVRISAISSASVGLAQVSWRLGQRFSHVGASLSSSGNLGMGERTRWL